MAPPAFRGLALELMNSQWIYVNGVVLVSPTELGIERSGPAEAALRLPYYAATAWYHKALASDLQAKDLHGHAARSGNLHHQGIPAALTEGGFISDAKKKEIAAKVARYSGPPGKSGVAEQSRYLHQPVLKELLRDRGYTVGRLDSRYLGIDRGRRRKSGLQRGAYFMAAFFHARHQHVPPRRAEIQNGPEILHVRPRIPWDNEGNRTGENLRQAMAQNPFLHVLFQSGYYDGACDYFNAKYSMWQLDPSGKLKDRLSWEGYRSGHMMYLRKDDLATSNEHLREFILKSIPKAGQSREILIIALVFIKTPGMLIPGVFYFQARHLKQRQLCRSCGSFSSRN